MMYKIRHRLKGTERLLTARLVLLFALLFSVAHEAAAQAQAGTETPPAQAETAPTSRRHGRKDGHGALLSRLNLTPEQREQIRQIRQQTEAEGRQLMRRMREARRALDLSIYFEDADETVVEARTRELAAVQAEALRLRTLTELRIRRVLTPEQLNVLREIRKQAAGRGLSSHDDREGFGRAPFGEGRRRRRHSMGETDAPSAEQTPRTAPELSPRVRPNAPQRNARP